MNKLIITGIAALFALPALGADYDQNGMQNQEGMSTEGRMNPMAGQGAPSNQPPDAETSDRTPEKATPTPPAQVDRSKAGETSDRTPGKHENGQ